MIDMSPDAAHFLSSVGIKAEQVEEFRLFRLHSANRETGVVEFREVAA
jgi:hypothetical protein